MTVGNLWAFQHNRCQMFCLMTVGVLWACQHNHCQKVYRIAVAGFVGMSAQSLPDSLPHRFSGFCGHVSTVIVNCSASSLQIHFLSGLIYPYMFNPLAPELNSWMEGGG